MDDLQKLEAIINANPANFRAVSDALCQACEQLGLDPLKYEVYLKVTEDAEPAKF